MKYSKYTLTKKDYPKEGFMLLYNTLNKSVSVFSEEDYKKIGTDKESEVKDLLELIKQGYVVRDDDDERSKLNMYFTRLKNDYSSYATMVYTTYDCNMQCPYCFENGIKENKTSMSIQTAHDTVEWIKEEISQYRPKFFSIAFSGGEPFLNINAISAIVSGVKEYCDEQGIYFQYGVLTNGTIALSDKELEFFEKTNLTFLQYTMDGEKNIHNRRRVLDGGSYDIIIENIQNNYKKLKTQVIVRINIDKENENYVEELLNDIKCLNIPDLAVDFAVRFETPCDKFCSNSAVASNGEMAAYIKKCMHMANEKGINHSRRYAGDSPCLSIVPRQFVIDPIGDLYKCAAFAGEKRYSVGSIYEKHMNNVYVDIVGHDAWHDCKNCPYVPLCGGGCLYLNRIEHGDFKKRNCQRKLFDSLVMETLSSTMDREKLIKIIQGEKDGNRI